MNYILHYENLIANAVSRNSVIGYKEKHHIQPKSMGGSNLASNLVELTAREHFVAHRLLAKIYPNSGMVHAVFKMACASLTTKKLSFTSRTYEHFRKMHAARVSNDKVAALKKSIAGKGKKQSKEHITARTASRKQNNEQWHAEATKDKISLASAGKIAHNKGKRNTLEQQAKHYAGVQKRKENGSYNFSPAHREKLRIAGTGQKRIHIVDAETRNNARKRISKVVQCPYCNKEGQNVVMKRWHFDNCKFKN